MKTRMDWRQAVLDLPVFDTHTHMNNPGVPIAAQNVWDILHYFWFQQELWSVGYPKNAMEVEEDQRIDLFVSAFERVRNTTWAMMVQETFSQLYGVDLSDAASIRQADEAVRAKGADPTWPREVVDRLNVKRITVNHAKVVDFPDLPGVGAAVPLWSEAKQWTQQIAEADDQHAVGEQAKAAAADSVARLSAEGFRGMRIPVPALTAQEHESLGQRNELPRQGASPDDVQAFLAHALFDALSAHGMFAQVFLGIYKLPGMGQGMGIGDPHCIPNLYPLFDRYTCDFELVAGSPDHNMDVAQAARIFPNVHAGGLWWYNFRPSTYRHAMQVRFEAVPADKSVILASDGRCIEWCFCKTLLVKWLMADFFHDQVKDGWINEADALWVAREWLHDAVERRYA